MGPKGGYFSCVLDKRLICEIKCWEEIRVHRGAGAQGQVSFARRSLEIGSRMIKAPWGGS